MTQFLCNDTETGHLYLSKFELTIFDGKRVDSVHSSFALVKTGLRFNSIIEGQSFIKSHLDDVLMLFYRGSYMSAHVLLNLVN